MTPTTDPSSYLSREEWQAYLNHLGLRRPTASASRNIHIDSEDNTRLSKFNGLTKEWSEGLLRTTRATDHLRDRALQRSPLRHYSPRQARRLLALKERSTIVLRKIHCARPLPGRVQERCSLGRNAALQWRQC